MPKAKHYEILKVGTVPEKRFLQKTMRGVHWTNSFFAHKFLTLDLALEEASKHENVVLIWINGNSWGEVNTYNKTLGTVSYTHLTLPTLYSV